jgi:hypothetical protein
MANPEPQPVSVEAQLAVINTKLDLLITTRDDHEIRLRKMEQFKWVLVGASAVAGGIAGNLAPIVIKG